MTFAKRLLLIFTVVFTITGILVIWFFFAPVPSFAGNTCACTTNADGTKFCVCAAQNVCQDNAASCATTCDFDAVAAGSFGYNCGPGYGECQAYCSGGGGGGAVRTAMNGIIYAQDTGKRWVKDRLNCNQSYLGVDVSSYDKNNNKIENASFTCNTECADLGDYDCTSVTVDGRGHFDTWAVTANEQTRLDLTIPVSSGYQCPLVRWEVIDRRDLSNGSDDVIISTGAGCSAVFTSAFNPFDWRYGVTFFLSAIENNNWWQVYNGGVHANGLINISRIPSASFLVRDPTYGLVSSSSLPFSVSLGSSGVPGKNWGIGGLTSNIKSSYDPLSTTFFTDIQNNPMWTKVTSSVDSLGGKPSPMYFTPSESETINSIISYNENKIVMVIFPSASDTLIVRKDIRDTSTSQDKTLILIVKGNIEISKGVSEIDAFIYATGNIIFKSAGINQDDPVIVTGGIYGNFIDFERDLRGVAEYSGIPAEYILYSPSAVDISNEIPHEMKDASIFWIVRD